MTRLLVCILMVTMVACAAPPEKTECSPWYLVVRDGEIVKVLYFGDEC